MGDKIVEVYEKAEDILSIINVLNKFSFDDLIKSDHFYYSLDQKDTEISILKKNFKEFHRVKLINKRKHKNGNISYDFYYELDDGSYLLYGIVLENIPILLNGYQVKRNFKELKRYMIKAYKDKLIG